MQTQSLSMDQRQRRFEYRGRILYEFDFRDATLEEAAHLMDRYMELIQSAPSPPALRVLINLERAPYSPNNQKWKAALPLIQQKVARSAVYGLSPFFRTVLLGYRALAAMLGQDIGRRMKLCRDRTEALEWLAAP